MEPRKVPHIHYDYINGTFREGVNNIKNIKIQIFPNDSHIYNF